MSTVTKDLPGIPLCRPTGEPLDSGAISQTLVRGTGKRWKDVILERHRFPNKELVDVMFKQHVFILNVGSPCTWEFKREGRLRRVLKAKGSVSFFPGYVPFFGRLTVEAGRSAEVLFVALDPVFVGSTADRLELDSDRIALAEQLRSSDATIRHIVLALQTGIRNGYAGDQIYGESLSTALAVHLLCTYGGAELRSERRLPGLPHDTLKRAVGYIQDQLETSLTVSEIARAVRISPYHFSRLFKESTGRSPHQYVIEARVRKARELLKSGRRTIGEAAYEVGFVDQSHLARHFKRVFGFPPKTILHRGCERVGGADANK